MLYLQLPARKTKIVCKNLALGVLCNFVDVTSHLIVLIKTKVSVLAMDKPVIVDVCVSRAFRDY